MLEREARDAALRAEGRDPAAQGQARQKGKLRREAEKLRGMIQPPTPPPPGQDDVGAASESEDDENFEDTVG